MRRFLAPPPHRPLPSAPPPTFSVIIAAYQAADVVGEAVASALCQTHPPVEVIVCDDGSTDDLEGALRPFRDDIVLIRKEHGGEGSAKNAAASAASGEFVAILDADDVYFPTRLEALADLASARPDLDILTTDAYLAVDGRIVRRCYDGRWRFEVEDQRREILRRNFIFGLAAVRRRRLLDAGGFDEAILWTTDWDCWLRLILAGARAGCVEEPLAWYRLRESSLSARREELVRGKIATLEKARRDPNLHLEEVPVLEASLRGYRRELSLLKLRHGLARGEPEARALARELATRPDLPVRHRLEAAAAAAAPDLPARLGRLGGERWWTGAGGTRIRRRSTRRGAVRVAFYTDAHEIGGAERSLAHLVAALSSRFRPVVVGVERRVVDAVAAGRPGTDTVVLPFIRARYDARAIAAHLRALVDLRPQVVHVSLASPWSSQMAICLASLMPRVRVVAVEQLPSPPARGSQRWLKRLTTAGLAAHVAVGERAAREVERLAGLPLGSVRTIYNGVPDLPLTPAERVSAGPTVGAVGRLEEQKGIDLLLRALAALPGVTALVVGDGREGERLRRMAERLGISQRVVWLGWQQEPRPYLAAVDLLALPSRAEGFPLAALEALLAAVPVVAADVGSVGEAVVHGRTGLLVPPDDPEALAEAIASLLADPGRRAEMGRRGRALVLARFSAQAMARRFEALYDEILA